MEYVVMGLQVKRFSIEMKMIEDFLSDRFIYTHLYESHFPKDHICKKRKEDSRTWNWLITNEALALMQLIILRKIIEMLNDIIFLYIFIYLYLV